LTLDAAAAAQVLGLLLLARGLGKPQINLGGLAGQRLFGSQRRGGQPDLVEVGICRGSHD
jgi:hypothetical protein